MLAQTDRHATLRRWVPWLIPIAALGAFMAPMVLTDSGFMPDWTNHLWLVRQQEFAIEHSGPSLYVSAYPLGAFYPHFAFYGGTLYALAAGLALVLGDTTVAYVASWAIAFAAAYGGTTWLSAQCGLRGWRAQMPGLFLVTSAYFVTNAYGRGAWPEFVAVSAIPLLVASGVRLLRTTWKPLPLVAFVGSAIVLTGSHNITLLFGTVFLCALAAVIAIAAWRRPTPDELRRGVALVGVGVLCVGVNLWFLLPDVWYANRTLFGIGEPFAFSTQRFLSSLGVLFHPGRVSFPEHKGQLSEQIYLQLPVLAFAWIVATLILVRRQATRLERRATWGIVVIAFPFAFLTATTEPWHWMPRLLRQIQFGYRLETYVILAATGLLIIALRQLDRAPKTVARPLTVVLATVMVVSSALAVWQVWNPGRFIAHRDEVFADGHRLPRSWYDGGTYRDNSRDLPILDAPHAPSRIVKFKSEDARAGNLTTVVDPREDARPILTNLAAGPYLIHVDGLDVIGRTHDGFLMVRRPADRLHGPITVHLSRPDGGPVEAGRAGTILAAVGLTVAFAWVIVRALRKRPRRPGRGAGTRPGADGGAPTGEGASTDRALMPTVSE